jgi:hypothetical protein
LDPDPDRNSAQMAGSGISESGSETLLNPIWDKLDDPTTPAAHKKCACCRVAFLSLLVQEAAVGGESGRQGDPTAGPGAHSADPARRTAGGGNQFSGSQE